MAQLARASQHCPDATRDPPPPTDPTDRRRGAPCLCAADAGSGLLLMDFRADSSAESAMATHEVAATQLSAAWRRAVAKRTVGHQRNRRAAAAVLIQRCYCAYVRRRKHATAALQIQCFQRGRCARLMSSRQAADEAWCADDFQMCTVPRTVSCCCVLSNDPIVSVVDGFLTAAECSALLACATGWRRSGVSTQPGRLGDERLSAGRTSTTALDNPDLAKALQPLRERLATLLGAEESRLEASQVLHYGVGGAYRWHYDAYDERTRKGQAYTRRRGQRVSTTIVYLDDVLEGGETAFFYLRCAVAPRAGRLLTFRNVSAPREDGRHVLHKRSFHAGLPVLRGSKSIVTTFLRER